MVDWNRFDQRQREINEEQQAIGDMRRSLFDFPAGDPTALLQKPMNPTNDFNGILTRDITTANLSKEEAKTVHFLLTSAIALDKSRKLFGIDDDEDADKWIDATIECIKASAMSITATSKGVDGWLGELFVTLKRKGEISAQFIKQKTGLLK